MAKSTNISKKTPAGKKKTVSPDDLVKGGKKSDVELTEDDLKKVAGGLKLDYKI